MAFRELGGDKSLPYESCWFCPYVGDTGVNESIAYDVVRQKYGAVNMPGKWKRREAMLQTLGVY